jgi:hypothetical protein
LAPVTAKAAAATVPDTVGSVTPPVSEREPAGVNTTVPAVALTATLPKFMSTVLLIAIGVTIVADADAVAETCAKVLMEIPMSKIARAMILICAFMVFVFWFVVLICLMKQRYIDRYPRFKL